MEKTGTVEIMAKAKDAQQLNRIFERMGYPAPVREDTAKKADARAPSASSSKERGNGARAFTEQATAATNEKPSVKARLAAYKAAAEAATKAAPAKETVKEAAQKSTPER